MKNILAGSISAFALVATAQGAFADEMPHLGDLTLGDPFFYTADQDIAESDGQSQLVGTGRPDTTHAGIPHLPVYFGYMNTNYTYRFITVAEQVFTMLGEGKHGLWRVQENGTIREYLRPGAEGLPEGADPLAAENLETVREDYASFLPDLGREGYRYPDQRIDEAGRLTFVDLPITHEKYEGRYADHEPIDLANFYCTMSGPDYPYAQAALDFAFAQPGANEVGPLGKRAGFDIKENYTQVLRLDHMPDARSWVNIGQPGKDELHVNWQAVDTSRTDAEYYIVERPFFNRPYIFLAAVYDNTDNEDFSYVRPDGAYWETVAESAESLKTEVTPAPRFHLENGATAEAVGLPIYGIHHPDRAAYGAGGACSFKGGDWARYPDATGGSGWPTQYEEMTPLCDAVLVDVKFYANLDGRDWNDPNKYLANAGTGSSTVTYNIEPGEYGVFTDPYNVARGTNPESMDVPSEITLTYPAEDTTVTYTRPELRRDQQATMIPAPSTSCRPIPG